MLITLPIKGEHTNLKKSFAKAQKTKKMGMKLALEACSLELIGIHHRGIDDVKNIVQLMPYCLGRKIIDV